MRLVWWLCRSWSLKPGTCIHTSTLGIVCALPTCTRSLLLIHCLHGTDRNCRYTVVPWNAPILLRITYVVLPRICGNAAVVRPSEFCLYTAPVADALQDVPKLT
ncbi:hypothetical protein EDB92DRAFT_1234776 [Lactarius akahatsu]|uniref:Uncharacterized protein n=1 Tax=Lactarius akahatsu TaxID=416441 RepID=A0AAD4LFP6_9AGAM|nr:hypothetical protein EDB92DRAFT_1234776 [Lactarius akahatsu]